MKKLVIQAGIPFLIGALLFVAFKATGSEFSIRLLDKFGLLIGLVLVTALFTFTAFENKKLRAEIQQLKGQK